MMTATLPPILDQVIALVTEAGIWLAAEFARPDGPRSSNHETSPIDTEIELFLRARLTVLLPARFVGEEAGVLAAEANGYCWVVDPHDGTRAFLEGRRGSAISVALLRQGTPVLGVVYAPTSPDRGPDMIAWAEGTGITRNGAPVSVDLTHRELAATDVVFLNHGAGQRPVWHSAACAPARFMPLPSIAYRLARVAVGDGIATVTLRPVNAHDIAAGHALLTAAGGVLVAEDGVPVTYGHEGDSRPSACFGGAPEAVATLRSRGWRGSTEPRRQSRVALTWPRAAEDARFNRAIGCMLGLLIGDSLGRQAPVGSHPGRVTDSGPVRHMMSGQPDVSEPALVLARSLARIGHYDRLDVASSYEHWLSSEPLDRGRAATDLAENGRAEHGGHASHPLVRIAPIGVWASSPEEAARIASEDCAISHPDAISRAVCAAFAAAISASILGADRRSIMEAALCTAEAADGATDRVSSVLRQAAAGVAPVGIQDQMDWIMTPMHGAFYQLAAGTAAEAALIASAGRGSSGAAVTGALLSAADGRSALPNRWIMEVLTCRPDPGLLPARPRPEEYWPDDLLDLTEALLLCRAPS